MSEQQPKQNKWSDDIQAWLKRALAWMKRSAKQLKLKTIKVSKAWRETGWPRIKSATKSLFRSVSATFQDVKKRASKDYREQQKKQQLSDIRSQYDKETDDPTLSHTAFDAASQDRDAFKDHSVPLETDVSTVNNAVEDNSLRDFDPLAAEDTQAADEKKDAKAILTSAADTVKQSLTGFGTQLKSGFNRRKQESSRYKPYQYKGIQSRLMRHGRQKVYRLKGYTTVARVNRKRRREYMKRQRNILLLTTLFLVILIIIFMWIDPVPKIQNLLHDIGFINRLNETP